MIFGRKPKAEPVEEPDVEVTKADAGEPSDPDLVAEEAEDTGEAAAVEDAVAVEDAIAVEDAVAADDADEADEDLPAELTDDAEIPEPDDVDWRQDGPFDFDEVDLAADEVSRLDLGSLILTPWEGMGLQLQVNEGSQQVVAALAFWEQSGLELALLAAPTSGGLAEELREDLTEEAEQAGGSATTATGPFGPELRRVLPAEGPGGEQMFQVSRTWFAEGPRWLLRGTLLGEAGLTEDEEGAAAPFVEFFRNVVVRRGDGPMVPGEVIAMTMPTVPQG